MSFPDVQGPELRGHSKELPAYSDPLKQQAEEGGRREGHASRGSPSLPTRTKSLLHMPVCVTQRAEGGTHAVTHRHGHLEK